MNIWYKFKKILFILFFTPENHAKKMGVKIGKDCSISTRNFGSEPYLISIGNHVQITGNVAFFTHGGMWVFRKNIPDFDSFGKIVIKDNTYIGYGSLILPGITIGQNVIVGAGSVVTKSIPDDCIVAGNPAKIIGKTNDVLDKYLKYNLKTKGMQTKEKRAYLLNKSEDNFIKKLLLTN